MIFSLLLMVQPAVDVEKICDDPQTQHQMNACAYEDYQAADKILNAQWKITYERMKLWDKGRKDDGRLGYAEALLTAQRNWIAFRDSHCLTEAYKFRGGTAEPLLRYSCLAAETNRRTEALAGLALEG